MSNLSLYFKAGYARIEKNRSQSRQIALLLLSSSPASGKSLRRRPVRRGGERKTTIMRESRLHFTFVLAVSLVTLAVIAFLRFGARNFDSHLVREFQAHHSLIYRIRYSPDGTKALSSSLDGRINLWDLVEGKQLGQFLGHKSGVRDIDFSSDGERFYSGGMDRTVRILDLSTGAET